MSDKTRSTAARARRTPALRAAARGGHAVNGLLHVTIALIALGIAGSGAAGTADPNGALTGLAQAPGGLVLIWVVILGMLALGLWQFVSAVVERDGDHTRRWLARAKLGGKGVAYLVIAAIGLRVAFSISGGESEEGLTARALATPGGVVLVVVAGLGALAVGVYLIVKGVRQRFRDDLRVPAGPAGTATVGLGVVGYVARGVAIGTIGVLFIVAAVTADPSQAGGLDDALATLAALPFGPVLLVAVALGFFAFGLYCFVRARFAKL